MEAKLRSFAVVPLLAVALAGCKQSAAAEQQRPPKPPAHVEKAEVVDADAPVLLHLTGTLRGMKEADLAANAAGRVLRTFVERGDEVKAGTVVAQLDTSAAALALKQAAVDVQTSKTQESINQADCARFEPLMKSGAISPAEYDNAIAKCKTAPLHLLSAQARESIAAKNVGDGTIRAPFSGVVSERYVEVGEYVMPNSKVVSIAENSDLRLELTIPEANIAAVKKDADVSFTVAAYPDKVFHGKVRHVSGSVRATTRDLVAEAVVPNPDRLLRPGMFTDVAISTGTRPLPSVPAAAVFERQDKKRVFVVKDGRLEERVLQEGPVVDERLAVESGVKTGEKVAIGNLANLLNGQSVD
ncbi:MAG: efflux RND transporter periplasmic adaptor subunit [Labilithrix sp.]|nr:efflux RND transporter periplasmic adaptor subunit [Labilithrix sp.]MCW5812762.1 efflux RND transporter periplasmic adaptor subunit [Labilithrix sp.]